MSDNRVYKTIGASNHTDKERQKDDFYATHYSAIDALLEKESFEGTIWECACGELDLSKRLEHFGYKVINSDLVKRLNDDSIIQLDYLKVDKSLADNIITNPPNKYAKEFMEKSLELLPNGGKLALFLPIRFLAGYNRGLFYQQHRPYKVLICSSRILCAKNGDFETMEKNGGTAIDYMWIIWKKGYYGQTITDWVNVKSKKKDK